MRRVGSVEEYVARPLGSLFAGATFVHFFVDDGSLCGTVVFGRPSPEDVALLTRAIAVELPDGSPVHRAFVDATRLTGIDPDAFRLLAEYVGPRAEAFGRNVSRQAIAHPPGALGLLVAGFYDVTPAWHPERTRLFAEREAALSWLGVEGPRSLLEELDRAVEGGVSAEVRAVKTAVAARPREVSVGAVAQSLGLTVRALQDRLRRQGTSFRREVNAARVSMAKELLASSDTKLGAIAAVVGCATLQHFTTLFRKEVGESPSAWRAAHRR